MDNDSCCWQGLKVKTWTHGIGMESGHRHLLVVQTWTDSIDMNSWYRHGLMVEKWNHGTDMDSCYIHELMVQTWTHGIDNTNGIDLDSFDRIGTPESYTYKRAECCQYAGFVKFQNQQT